MFTERSVDLGVIVLKLRVNDSAGAVSVGEDGSFVSEILASKSDRYEEQERG